MVNESRNRPGGETAKRQVRFFFACDRSYSMDHNGKMQSLNTAIREAMPAMNDVANDTPDVDFTIQAVSFGGDVRWDIAVPTKIQDAKWVDLQAGGGTPMGNALEQLAAQLSLGRMPEHGLPPILVLISDGQPTDDFWSGLAKLDATPWGRKGIRLAIGIGKDADYEILAKFANQPGCPPFHAHNAHLLAKQVRFVSTTPFNAVSKPKTIPFGPGPVGPIEIPTDLINPSVRPSDVW